MKKFFLILIGLVLVSCSLDTESVKFHGWKYGGGHYLGDTLFFGNELTFEKDSIFRKNVPIAKVKTVKKRLDGSIILIIESFDTKEEGTYHAKYKN